MTWLYSEVQAGFTNMKIFSVFFEIGLFFKFPLEKVSEEIPQSDQLTFCPA